VVLDRRLPAAVLKMVSNLLPAKLGDALSGVSDTQQAVHMLEASAEAVLLKYDVVHPTTKTLMVRFYDWTPLDVERAQLRKVFRHYCKTHRSISVVQDGSAAGMGGAGLSLHGWLSVLDDAHILGISTTRQLHPREAEAIFKFVSLTFSAFSTAIVCDDSRM
jgi:hypothetical protein